MVVGYTSGVFDLFHEGHLRFLSLCRDRCDFLFVGVDVDSMVKSKKGCGRPHQSHMIRCNNVLKTEMVDIVFLKKMSSVRLMKSINPSIYFISNSKNIRAEMEVYLKSNEIDLGVIQYTHGISTTLISEEFQCDEI